MGLVVVRCEELCFLATKLAAAKTAGSQQHVTSESDRFGATPAVRISSLNAAFAIAFQRCSPGSIGNSSSQLTPSKTLILDGCESAIAISPKIMALNLEKQLLFVRPALKHIIIQIRLTVATSTERITMIRYEFDVGC